MSGTSLRRGRVRGGECVCDRGQADERLGHAADVVARRAARATGQSARHGHREAAQRRDALRVAISAPSPTGNGCPEPCTSCKPGVCTIECSDSGNCAGKMLACPAGFDCQVQCKSAGACSNATIECPESLTCALDCKASNSCTGATLACSSDGPCSVKCLSSSTSCADTNVACGKNSCSAQCGKNTKPQVDCGSACSCNGC